MMPRLITTVAEIRELPTNSVLWSIEHQRAWQLYHHDATHREYYPDEGDMHLQCTDECSSYSPEKFFKDDGPEFWLLYVPKELT